MSRCGVATPVTGRQSLRRGVTIVARTTIAATFAHAAFRIKRFEWRRGNQTASSDHLWIDV